MSFQIKEIRHPIELGQSNIISLAVTTSNPQQYVVVWEEHICELGFLVNRSLENIENYLKKRYPNFSLKKSDAPGYEYQEYTKLLLMGTDFQRQVWKELLKIKRGHTTTYKEIARAINNPKATQAVGTAVGANPISPIIPCHRVIRTDGSLGGFAYGQKLKAFLLEKEGVNF